MNKENYEKLTKEKFKKVSKEIVLKQINNFYDCLDKYTLPKHNYNIGDNVFLKKHTLLHGTYGNLDSLKLIVENGLIASLFTNGRISKYPSCVSVWNLKQDYLLKDYINFYSGATVRFFNQHDDKKETGVIEYDKMKDIINIIKEKGYLVWQMEQTKEARFLPSLVQDKVQIGIIFNVDNFYGKELLKGDVQNPDNIQDKFVLDFVNEKYGRAFLEDRKNKDDFFTDRESAIIFGIPSNLIEGILVGKQYENDKNKLNEIKELLPNAYICNLEGKVIVI